MDAAKLKKLRDHWESVLERDGLGDIEKDGHLRVHHDQFHWCRRLPGFDPVKNEAKELYYQLACQFLYSYDFESQLERRIWEMHSQGMPVRKIASRVGQPKNWSNINKRLLRLRRAMLGQNFSK